MVRFESPPEPEKAEIEKVLEDLIAGRCSRTEAADWAARWVIADDPAVEDEAVWTALGDLAAADLKTAEHSYLYEETDFRQWLEDLRTEARDLTMGMIELSRDEWALSVAWRQAGKELGVAVENPYGLHWNGRMYPYPVFLPQFGGGKGALLVALESPNEHERSKAGSDAGFFVSRVNAETYSSYERGKFVDTLNDLGWFGPDGQAPKWYTGESWE
jgi:hypothetical protein